MSSLPSKDFSYFIRCFDDHLNEASKLFESKVGSQTAIKALQKNVKVIKEGIERKKVPSPSLSFDIERDMITRCVEVCSHTMPVGSSEISKIERVAADLLAHLQAIQNLGLHFKEVEGESPSQRNKNLWMRRELCFLVSRGDVWAIEQLNDLVGQQDQWAIELLMQASYENESCMHLLREYMKRPEFVDILANLYQSWDPIEISMPILSLKAYALSLDLKELADLYDQFCKKFSQDFTSHFFAYLLSKEERIQIFYPSFIHRMEENDPISLAVCTHLLNSFDEVEKVGEHLFVRTLITQCTENFNLMISLLSLMNCFMGRFEIAQKIAVDLTESFKSKDLKIQRLAHALIVSSQYIYADLNHQESTSKKEALEEQDSSLLPGDYFSFSRMSFMVKYKMVRGLIKRKEQLIQFFMGGLNPKEYEDIPLDEYRNPSKQLVMVGNDKTVTIAKNVAQIVRPEGYTTTVLGPLSRNFKESDFSSIEGIDILKGEMEPTIWMRDYYFPFESSHRIPSFSTYHWEFQEALYIEREQRVGFEPPMGSMGQVGLYPSHLRLYEYCERMDEVLSQASEQGAAASPVKRPVKFQFCVYEGGNVHIGSSKGKPWVIIGKDMLGYNRRRLQYELAKLGIYNEEGEWKMGVPYLNRLEFKEPSSEADKKAIFMKNSNFLPPLPDHVLLELMKLDFGGAEITMVEQPRYHLDVASTVIDPENKTILLNDSTEALLIYLKRLDRIDQKTLSPRVINCLSDRLSQANEIASNLTRMEDLTEKDLEVARFKVIRIPGIFQEEHRVHPKKHQINFFNCFPITNAQRSLTLLALGAPKSYQDLYVNLLSKYWKEVKNVGFLSQKASEELLRYGGGIHCILRFLV